MSAPEDADPENADPKDADRAPFLTTARLELWRPVAGDVRGLNALTADPETRKFLGQSEQSLADSYERMLRQAGSWMLYGYGTVVMRKPGAPQIIGSCGIFHSWRGFGMGMDDVPEAGWVVDKDHWGQGLAGEAMRAVLAWFDAVHGRRRVVCMIDTGHAVSDRLARTLGFRDYDVRETDDDPPLVLYERFGARP